MTSTDWYTGRKQLGLTQVQASQRLGVSQAYLSQLEKGKRQAPDELSNKALGLYGLPPTALPLATPGSDEVSPDHLQGELAGLGYPGFSHVRSPVKANPARVVLEALVKRDLDARLVEALPWSLCAYPELNWPWLLDNVKLRNAQNRLGYLVGLSKYVVKQVKDDPDVLAKLSSWEKDLEDARLANEGTLCRDSMPESERAWLRKHRPKAAAHWGLLTSLTADQLFYAKRR